jgi:hypothetical protein
MFCWVKNEYISIQQINCINKKQTSKQTQTEKKYILNEKN